MDTSRLKKALLRKEKLEADKNRIYGRLESAKKNLLRLEKDCEAKKVPPDRLEEVLSKLQARYEERLNSLEDALSIAEEQMENFVD